MNTAVIFAGGVGKRMHTRDKPKQFLMVHGKPIVVHTIEIFQEHPSIDAIVVVCVEGWIDEMRDLVERYRLGKVCSVVPGGQTGQLSIRNGLFSARDQLGVKDNYVLIHDGVRPLVSAETISANIEVAHVSGSAVTCVPAKETVVVVNNDGDVEDVLARKSSLIARAPQTFQLGQLLEAHDKAFADGLFDFIDSCTLMHHYGYSLATVEGNMDNIKVTTPEDFYTFRAIYDARENDQLQ